jgi:RNA polymerase sigma-54 factor
MTPMLQQAMKILQLSTLELKEWIDQEMQQNPVLEVEEVDIGQMSVEDIKEGDRKNAFDKITEERRSVDLCQEISKNSLHDQDFLSFYSDLSEADDSTYPSEFQEQEEIEADKYSNQFVKHALTLSDHLKAQLALYPLTNEEQWISKILIGNINENGYLEYPIDQIFNLQKIKFQKIKKILNLIQTMDPAGIGARNLRECLLIQLREKKGTLANKAYQLILNHFENIISKKYSAILNESKWTDEEFREVLKLISKLEPKPGRNFSSEIVQNVVPDLWVQEIDGRYVVELNDGEIPNLHISQYYRKLIKDKVYMKDVETKKFLEKKIQSALWLIKSIEQRRKTIFRVGEAIFKIQEDFLRKGISYLKPLTLKQIAEIIGMHESTISRVTTHKYVQTPRGLFELKYFFTSSLELDTGVDISSRSVKDMIHELLISEPSGKPYSDQKIMEWLRKKGVMIARRTVAKYREMLKIPAARYRKKI